MRLLLLCLTVVCGYASAGELFQPYTRPNLTAEQMNQRDRLVKQPGFKSITTVKVDRAALRSSVLTMTLKGKTYRIKGERSRAAEPVVGIGQRQIGGFRWAGQSAEGSGSWLYSDEGHFLGDFTLGGQHYTVAGSEGMCMVGAGPCFLVEALPPEPGPPSRALFRPIPTVLSAEQVSAQEDYYKATGFKTIETIRIDRAVLNLDSHVVALTVDGKKYRLTSISQMFDRSAIDPNRRLKISTWGGQDDAGRVDVSDDGRVLGEFILGGQIYRVMSGEGVDFLLRSDKHAAAPAELFQPIPVLTAEQERVRAALVKEPHSRSITAVQFNKAVLDAKVITMTIKGQKYRLYAKWPKRRMEGNSGLVSWYGEGPDGHGSVLLFDDGRIVGDLSLRGTYRLSTLTMDGIGFVTEYVPQPFICGTPSGTVVKKRSGWWPFS